MPDREKVIKELEWQISVFTLYCAGDERLLEAMKAALTLLKEQEEKPLRCDKCSYHREDGWCGMHGLWVKETDYCSLGAWEGR